MELLSVAELLTQPLIIRAVSVKIIRLITVLVPDLYSVYNIAAPNVKLMGAFQRVPLE